MNRGADRRREAWRGSRLRKSYCGTMGVEWFARLGLSGAQRAGCSKRLDFSPAQPWRAKARLSAGKAVVSENAAWEKAPFGAEVGAGKRSDFFNFLLGVRGK